MNAALSLQKSDESVLDLRTSMINRAKAMAPELSRRAALATQERMVSRDSVQLMREAGFLKLLRPKRFGGDEADFDIFVQVLDELAQGCASSAWVCTVLTEHSWFISCFPEQAQLDVWGKTPDACASASFAPRPVQAVPGGYKASGLWSFASGCDHASWFLLGAIGEAGPMFILVPASDVELVDDWHTLGLRGTGSKSVQLTAVFVPAYRTLSYANLMSGTGPGAQVHPDYYLCRTPQQLLAPYSLPSVMLGQAQKALDAFTDSLYGRKLPDGTAMAEQQMLQVTVAECAAEIDMVRLLIQHKCRQGVARMRARQPLSYEESLDGRRDFHIVARRLLDVVLKLCAISGSRWVYDGDPLQMILRDVMTASAHRGACWDGLLGSGRAMLGLPPPQAV